MLTDKQKEQVESLLRKDAHEANPNFSSHTVAAKLGLTKEYVDTYLKER
jgi:hypothetical protein